MKESSLVIVGDWGWRLFIRSHKEVLGMMDVFTTLIVMMTYAYVKTHEIIHFKYDQLIVCQLYINKGVKTETERWRESGNHLGTGYIVPFIYIFYGHLLNFLTFS